MMLAGAGLGVAVALAGCGSSSDGGSAATNPSNDGSSATKADHASGKPDMKLTNILDSEYYKGLTPKQQATIKKLHEMDVETFKKQSAETQHMFSRAERDAYRGYTIKNINDLLSPGITPGSQTAPPGESASAKQIMESQMIEGSTAFMMLTRNEDPNKIYNANRADAIKTELGSVADENMEGSKSDVNNLDSIDELNGNMYYMHVKTARQLSSTSSDGVRERVIAAHYTEVDDGLANIYDQTYTVKWITYTNIKGDRVGEWMAQDVHRT